MSKTVTEFHLKVLFLSFKLLINFFFFFQIHQNPLMINTCIPREQSFYCPSQWSVVFEEYQERRPIPELLDQSIL